MVAILKINFIATAWERPEFITRRHRSEGEILLGPQGADSVNSAPSRAVWLMALLYHGQHASTVDTRTRTPGTYRRASGSLQSWHTRLSCFALRVKKRSPGGMSGTFPFLAAWASRCCISTSRSLPPAKPSPAVVHFACTNHQCRCSWLSWDSVGLVTQVSPLRPPFTAALLILRSVLAWVGIMQMT